MICQMIINVFHWRLILIATYCLLKISLHCILQILQYINVQKQNLSDNGNIKQDISIFERLQAKIGKQDLRQTVKW